LYKYLVEGDLMFELKKGYDEYVNKTFRIPVRVVDKLDKLSAEYSLSVNKIVIQCIEYALNNMVKKDNNLLKNDAENEN